MVDKKHHHCTGDIVLKINVAYVGTRRVRYSYQPKRMPMQEKPAHLTQSQSQEWNHDKVSTTDQSFSPNNDVMNTKPLLAYLSQNLASRGYEKCLDT